MPRPQKQGEDKRDYSIEIRVTFAEKTAIQIAAKDSRLTVSDFARARLIEAKPLRHVPNADRELLLKHLAETNKQGSNLNQIARVLNMEGNSKVVSQQLMKSIETAIAKYEEAHNTLMELLVW
ncbi:plasmid mobilization protein [Mucilaginibacter pedocola]|uniref:Uncharacterized protein n=1 Tax=Mucilaginibacter pedocola TaxID=1792845 RepID=A0A1S9PMM0_9SPHI|nr:plasmid mobilization relaxosome protein MobC [Mucilaginibacter pedocola]OOQ62195.1 hypothetical protein BC343_03895 [Mucilaginibacter pedocola]